jgi:hypothetical protein
MFKKPSNLIYGVEDKPPVFENIILGIQHISIFFISICFPVIIVTYLGDSIDEQTARGFISFSMISAGLVTIFQSFKESPVGSGYFIQSVCGPSYMSASMMAAASGGLPLLFGMTGFVGAVEVVFSRFMNRLRFLFPTEVTGVIVLMVGIQGHRRHQQGHCLVGRHHPDRAGVFPENLRILFAHAHTRHRSDADLRRQLYDHCGTANHHVAHAGCPQNFCCGRFAHCRHQCFFAA